MFDIFISHSSKDKPEFVELLINELKNTSLSVWYDQNSIIFGDDIKNKIMTGIQNALLFVIILSDSFLKSCWANLELGIAKTSKVRILPILYNIELSTIAEKYPFILTSKYLISERDDIHKIVNIISETVMFVKEEMGFTDYHVVDLTEVTRKLRSYNNFKLDQISVHMRNIIKEINSGMGIALNTITFILDFIISDLCEIEHIYLNEEISKLKTIKNSGILNENISEHFRFLYKTRDDVLKSISRSHETLNKQDLYLIQFSLYSILDWYMKNYFRLPIINNEGIVVILPSQITEDDINETYIIEKLVLPHDLIAGPEMTKAWYLYNNLTLLGARDKKTGKLIGFIHTLPVTEDLFKQISCGNFDDTIISNSDIRQYDIPGFYKLYISSICIHPKYNGSIAFKVMYSNFIEMLLSLAQENEIYISDIIADGVTPKGKILCESIGMVKHCNSIHDTPVYKAQLIPPSISPIKLVNQRGKQLFEYYQKVYEEYKNIF